MNYAIKDVDNQITTISAEISKNQKNNLPDAFENTKQLRDLLCQQLKITYNLLEDITSCANDFNKTDSELTAKAEMLFEKLGIHIQSVIVYKDFNDNIFVEAYKLGRLDTDVVKLTVELGIALNCDLAMPDSIFVNGLSKLTFSRASKFKITSGFKQLCSEGNDCCGDTLERVWISSNQYMVILSDGMGTGKRARLDSTFTTDLITRFSACGISPVTALKFINSILRVKGWDESFATADIALFDTCNGNVDFIKSGAFDSFIVRDGSLIKIQSKAFPLGILTDATPTVDSYKFYDGDLVILASDGVSEKAVRLATEQLRKNNLSACELSELICRYVKEYSTEQKNDDISVCVVSIKEC